MMTALWIFAILSFLVSLGWIILGVAGVFNDPPSPYDTDDFDIRD